MRRIIDIDCEGATLAATHDDGHDATGLLIVSGGNEIRIGAHRGMAKLALDISAAGHPVFRFDRRGVGDSEGENGGFRSSGPDISAAISSFRSASPQLTRIIAFGNCDAATALVLHAPGADALVLANPWVIELADDLPPPAAIQARYARRLRDPQAWLALISGRISLSGATRGLVRLLRARLTAQSQDQGLAASFAAALARFTGPVTILTASGDNTAIAFADAWRRPLFGALHARASITQVTIDSKSHSFASDADYAALKNTLLGVLKS